MTETERPTANPAAWTWLLSRCALAAAFCNAYERAAEAAKGKTPILLAERKQPRRTTRFEMGDFTRPADEATPGTPAILPRLEYVGARPNRLDLARWLVHPANPLTSRVVVNRVWQQYFGVGLVEAENEFVRTPMGEEREFTGRNHHIDAFTMWFAGGGFKPGVSHGTTDEFGFGVVDKPAHVRDIHATLLHQLGLDHQRLSVRFQGLDIRLTGAEPARVLSDMLT